MTKTYPTLSITADFGGSIGEQTGIFELISGTDSAPRIVEDGIQTDFIADSAAGSLLSVLTDVLSGDQGDRKGIHLDAGTGEHYFDLSFVLDNTTKRDGSYPQWGSTADTTVRRIDSATGADPLAQEAVLTAYLRYGTTGSTTPATLEWGEYAADGLADPVDVAIRSASITEDSRDPGTLDGSLSLVETQSVADTIDAIDRPPY